MNKFAPYFQIPGTGEDVLDAWPGLESALFMDIDPDRAKALRWNYPGLKICLRLYEGGLSWQTTSPEDWAARFYPVRPEYAISWTLPLGQDDRNLFAAFDNWSLRFAAACRTEGIEPVGLCVGTGNFTGAPDRIKVSEAFPRICQMYDILGPQDYGWPTLQAQESWHALRWKAWHDDIKEKFGKEMLFMPMECGLTQAVLKDRPDLGWQSGADGVTDDSYVATMKWYNEWLCKLPYVVRAYIYLFHGLGEWETFDHVRRPEVWHKIRDFDAETPNNGGDSTVKIYNFNNAPPDGATTTWDWLRSVFGDKLVIHPVSEVHQLKDGDWYYKVDYLDARAGDSNCIINVRDENGQPVVQETVIFWWKSAEPHGYPDNGWNWTENGASGDTNPDGDVGPGMGKGAYYDPKTQEGPHKVWVYDLPSEMVSGIGMIPGGDPDPGTPGEEGPHAHVNIGYRRVRWTGGEPPPPPPTEDPIARLREIGKEIIAIADGLGGTGTVSQVVVVYNNGSQVVCKPSLAASVVSRVKAVLRL